jgi:hypothetical protein
MGSNCTFLIGGCPLVLASPSAGRFAMVSMFKIFQSAI